MGAPTAATKKRATKKAEAKVAGRVDGVEFTDDDIARMEADLDTKFVEAGPIGPDGTITPVIVGKAGKAGTEMVHIFSLDGEPYHIPKRPPIAVMLRFMRDVRKPGEGARYNAIEQAMMSMLGKSKLDALCESEDTSDDDVANVFIIVGHILFTAIKNWKAKVDPALDPS